MEILAKDRPRDVVTRFTENILAQIREWQALVETPLRQARLKTLAGYPSAPVAVDELFTQLSEAQYSVGGKNTLTLRPSLLVVVADAELLAGAGQCVGQCHRLYA